MQAPLPSLRLAGTQPGKLATFPGVSAHLPQLVTVCRQVTDVCGLMTGQPRLRVSIGHVSVGGVLPALEPMTLLLP